MATPESTRPWIALNSLSRLMRKGAGPGRTREDHLDVAAQVFASLARARQARELAELVGEDALSATDRSYLSFEQTVEQRLLNQRRDEARTLDRHSTAPGRRCVFSRAGSSRCFRTLCSTPATPSLPRGRERNGQAPTHPPGRAGRLWLQHRLSTAQHGADLLDHKLRILRTEREQLALQQDRMAAEWESASREADMWLLRGVLLGGQRSVRLAAAPAPAEVRILWEQSMGVRYPAEATCTVPDPSPGTPPPSNAALVAARDCYRRAVRPPSSRQPSTRQYVFSRRKRRPLVADSGPSRTGGSPACSRPWPSCNSSSKKTSTTTPCDCAGRPPIAPAPNEAAAAKESHDSSHAP